MQVKANAIKPLANENPKKTKISADDAPQESTKDATKEITNTKYPPSAESTKTNPVPLEKLDSIHNPYNTPSHNLNAINTALGELEVMTKTINTLQKHQKSYQKLAMKLEAAQESEDETAIQQIEQEAGKIQDKMQEAYNFATFGGKNVFHQNYAHIVPEVAISGKSINPNTLEIKNPEAIMDYAMLLKEQKSQVKSARKILYKRAQKELDELAKTDSSYEKLNRDKLLSKEFKAAQGGRGIRAERVLRLLNLD